MKKAVLFSALATSLMVAGVAHADGLDTAMAAANQVSLDYAHLNFGNSAGNENLVSLKGTMLGDTLFRNSYASLEIGRGRIAGADDTLVKAKVGVGVPVGNAIVVPYVQVMHDNLSSMGRYSGAGVGVTGYYGLSHGLTLEADASAVKQFGASQPFGTGARYHAELAVDYAVTSSVHAAITYGYTRTNMANGVSALTGKGFGVNVGMTF